MDAPAPSCSVLVEGCPRLSPSTCVRRWRRRQRQRRRPPTCGTFGESGVEVMRSGRRRGSPSRTGGAFLAVWGEEESPAPLAGGRPHTRNSRGRSVRQRTMDPTGWNLLAARAYKTRSSRHPARTPRHSHTHKYTAHQRRSPLPKSCHGGGCSCPTCSREPRTQAVPPPPPLQPSPPPSSQQPAAVRCAHISAPPAPTTAERGWSWCGP